MSIMANTLAAKKQFDTRKWWVWALQGYTHVFYMIPSFKIDHSQITELDSMNISTSLGVSSSYVIYCQLRRLIPNRALKVHLSTMFDINEKKKKEEDMSRESRSDKPDLRAAERWLYRRRLQFPRTPPTENNSVNSLIISLTSVIQFILLNRGARECLDWKEPDICTPLLSHIIQRTNLFRSLTTIVLLIAQAPAIF